MSPVRTVHKMLRVLQVSNQPSVLEVPKGVKVPTFTKVPQLHKVPTVP